MGGRIEDERGGCFGGHCGGYLLGGNVIGEVVSLTASFFREPARRSCKRCRLVSIPVVVMFDVA